MRTAGGRGRCQSRQAGGRHHDVGRVEPDRPETGDLQVHVQRGQRQIQHQSERRALDDDALEHFVEAGAEQTPEHAGRDGERRRRQHRDHDAGG
jgi:hypothetical protein